MVKMCLLEIIPANINDVDFGIVFSAYRKVNFSTSGTLSIDHIRITVYYTEVVKDVIQSGIIAFPR